MKARPLPINLLLILITLYCGIGGAGYLYYRTQRDESLREKQKDLLAIGALKSDEISRWIRDRREGAELIRSSACTARLLDWLENSAKRPPQEEVSCMRSLQELSEDCWGLLLLDRVLAVRLRTGPANLGTHGKAEEMAAKAIQGTTITWSDLYFDQSIGQARIDYFIPLRSAGTSPATASGVLVLSINPYKFLFPLIESWPTNSPTAETLLVRREGDDVLYLNELRHRKKTALKLRFPLSSSDLPAAKAIRGNTGLTNGTDYRGIRVEAALVGVRDTPWFLVCKVDESEIHEPIREAALTITLAVIAMILAAGTSIGYVWKKQTGEYYRQLSIDLEREIAERNRVEEELRESQSRYRVLVGNLPGIVYRVHIQEKNRMEFFNDALLGISGYQAADLHAGDVCSIDPLIHDEDRGRVIGGVRSAIKNRSSFSIEYRLHTKTKGDIFVLEQGVPIYDENGNALYIDGLIFDITDRKQAEAERENLIKDLGFKNAELERFTYTASHDLKSPLITIKGFVSMLAQDLADGKEDRIRGDLARISDAADKMAALLNDLLELSRIGRIIGTPNWVPFRQLIADAIELVSGRIAAKKVEVVVQPEFPRVYGDRKRLLDVMQNLIDNAAKFMGAQPNPRIEIGSRLEGTKTVIYVRDNGIGIDSRFHENVFGLFNKLDPTSEGTGIGLARAKRIVEVHSGRIWVESDGVGHGSTFCLTLPEPSLGK